MKASSGFGKISEGDEMTLEERKGQEGDNEKWICFNPDPSSWTFCYPDFLILEAYADGTGRVTLDTQLKAEITTGHYPLRICKKEDSMECLARHSISSLSVRMFIDI